MTTVTADFETFYCRKTKYSLSSMTTQEYINDPRFEAIMLSCAVNDEPPITAIGSDIPKLIKFADIQNSTLVAHNAMFDASISKTRYGVMPKNIICTMSMARSTGLASIYGGSLDALIKAAVAVGYDIPLKGNAVINADGKRLEDFSVVELDDYALYCETDVGGCRSISNIMAEWVTADELKWQDIIMKCFANPELQLDRQVLEDELVRIKTHQATTMLRAAQSLGVSQAQFRTILMSNAKFAELLESHGVEPPMKISPSTGRPTFAFAKTDEEFIALEEHPNEDIQAFVAARLGNKSTISQTRTEKFLHLTQFKKLPMPYYVSGAINHRLAAAGGEAMNVQNLPSGRIKGQSKAIRRSIIAPDGMACLAVDSAQVELRTAAWISNDVGLLDVFRQGRDPYSEFASVIYNVPADVIKAGAKSGDDRLGLMRQIGKTALLGCIYGAGVNGFLAYCKNVAKVPMTIDLAEFIVKTFRSVHAPIKNSWYRCGDILQDLGAGRSGTAFGLDGMLLSYDADRQLLGTRAPGILLPDGNWLSYPNLKYTNYQDMYKSTGGKSEVESTDNDMAFFYTQRKGSALRIERTYSSKIFQNINSALAFAAMKYQLIKIDKVYRVLGNVHDEGICIIPEDEKEKAIEFAENTFKEVPPWMVGCPLKGEAGVNKRYGDC